MPAGVNLTINFKLKDACRLTEHNLLYLRYKMRSDFYLFIYFAHVDLQNLLFLEYRNEDERF